jgi:N-acetylmuramoyl-L-alanine amidase
MIVPGPSRRSATLALLVALAPVACRTAAPPAPAPATAPAPRRATPLPPVPRVDGPLAIRVVYPGEGQTIASRDSNFILGSVGNGGATLRINGEPVRVLPNGSFLAWLPVPPRSAPTYVLEATTGTDVARLVRRVAIASPAKPLPAEGPLVVDSSSATPRGARTLMPDEAVRVSVRAPVNASVRVQLSDGRTQPMVDLRVARGGTAATGDAGATFVTDLPASALRGPARIVVARGADTVRFPISEVTLLDPSTPQYVMLGAASVDVPDTDRVVIARPLVGGTYKWFILPGTVLELTGRIGENSRVRLDDRLDVWVSSGEVRALPAGTPRPRRVASNARVVSSAEWADVVIPIGERPPHEVREEGNDLVLTLYGTVANTDIINYPATDSLVRLVSWRQVTDDRAEFRVHLSRAPYGYLAMWSGTSFVLRVRRPPRIDPARPLAGLTIAVNAGHPPAGATGPTGLYEAVPTLEVSRRVARELEARGARAVMVRTTADPLALALRPVIARRANANAFVSIHLNALPDGINPFTTNGTGTYYFNPLSEPLARAVQQGMVASMGLRDLGLNYDNLSDVRPTWMPMVLCEGAFIIVPEQEAAMRTPEFQEAYARGVVDGLEAYFRARAGR